MTPMTWYWTIALSCEAKQEHC